MTASRMDEIEDLIATAQHELNPDDLHIGQPGYEDIGHPLWGSVTYALNEAIGEVYRLKVKLAWIAQTAARESG